MSKLPCSNNETPSDWATLPQHLLDLIVKKLVPSADYLRFGAVCVQWHSNARYNRITAFDHQAPLLLIPGEDEHTYRAYDVIRDKFLESKLSVPYNKRFCGSSDGWLVVVNKDWTVTLHQPNYFTAPEDQNNEEYSSITLPCLFPPLFDPDSDGYDYDDDIDPTEVVERESDEDSDDDFTDQTEMVEHESNEDSDDDFTDPTEDSDDDFTDPTAMVEHESNEDSDDDFIDPTEICDYHIWKAIVKQDQETTSNELTVFVIFGHMKELAFIRVGRDATWTKIDALYNNKKITTISDILYYNNQFHAACYKGDVISFDITDSLNLKVNSVTPPTPERYSCHITRYLVKSIRGDLLQVERYFVFTGDYDARVTKAFRVYKLDFIGREWIKIKSLGDGVSLFLGDNSSVSVLASDFDGCQPNCIYFMHDVDSIQVWSKSNIYDLGVYYMESKTFKFHYTIDPAALRGMSKRPPIWFAPSILL